MLERDICIVGAGNVASHLAKALTPRVCAVVSRSLKGADDLASGVGCPAFSDFSILKRLPDGAVPRPQIIIISVADHALSNVVDAIGRLDYDPLVVHTSGSMPMEVLLPISPRTGILYPLQTFTKGCPVDISRVPFFNEAATDADLQMLDNLASSISDSVHHADAESRKALHIAGVFTSNFTNILLEGVQRVLADAGYDLDVVRPLLEATVDKAFRLGPHEAQTGPARRGDGLVINRHIESLPADLKPVYKVLTDAILRSHNVQLKID